MKSALSAHDCVFLSRYDAPSASEGALQALKAPFFAHDGAIVCGYGAPPANRGVLLAPRAPFAHDGALLVDTAPLTPA